MNINKCTYIEKKFLLNIKRSNKTTCLSRGIFNQRVTNANNTVDNVRNIPTNVTQYGLRFKSFILESGSDFKRENSISTWCDSTRKYIFKVYHLRLSDCGQRHR